MSAPVPSPAPVRVPDTVRWGVVLALATAAISGVSVWLNSFAVREVPDAAVFTTLKNAMAAAILIGAVAMSGGVASARRLTGGQWTRLAFIGLLGGSIPFLLFFTGLAQASAPGAAFIHKTLFVWVALLAVPLLGERLGWAQILAMGVLLGGLVVLAPPDLSGASWGPGETMIAVATLLWSVEVILAKRLLVSVPPAVVGAGRLGIGVLFLVAYLAATGSLGGIAAVPPAGWAWVAVTGILLAGYVGSWLAALRRAPASLVTSVLVLGAVLTSVLQSLSKGALPSSGAVAGSAILALTVGIVVVAGSHRARSRLDEAVP